MKPRPYKGKDELSPKAKRRKAQKIKQKEHIQRAKVAQARHSGVPLPVPEPKPPRKPQRIWDDRLGSFRDMTPSEHELFIKKKLKDKPKS